MDIDIDQVVANSFRDFHAKGLDYLCLSRSDELTRKVYFFDGATVDGESIVAPHDHRYSFKTTVHAGRLINFRYKEVVPSAMGLPFNCFAWRSPLLGGDGFEFAGETKLRRATTEVYGTGTEHSHRPDELHTITVQRDTVIELEQYEDIVPHNEPTFTYLPADKGKEPPPLSGLYSAMTEDQVVRRLRQYAALTGTTIKLIG